MYRTCTLLPDLERGRTCLWLYVRARASLAFKIRATFIHWEPQNCHLSFTLRQKLGKFPERRSFFDSEDGHWDKRKHSHENSKLLKKVIQNNQTSNVKLFYVTILMHVNFSPLADKRRCFAEFTTEVKNETS